MRIKLVKKKLRDYGNTQIISFLNYVVSFSATEH